MLLALSKEFLSLTFYLKKRVAYIHEVHIPYICCNKLFKRKPVQHISYWQLVVNNLDRAYYLCLIELFIMCHLLLNQANQVKGRGQGLNMVDADNKSSCK